MYNYFVNISESSVIHIGSGTEMGQCFHEEADTRVVHHAFHAIENDSRLVRARTVDIDVVVILSGMFARMKTLEKDVNILVDMGVGRNFVQLSIEHIFNELGEAVCSALPIFHAFTGCDQVSAFYGKGKKTALSTWQSCDAANQAFLTIAKNPFPTISTDSDLLKSLEKLTIQMYKSHSPSKNQARMELLLDYYHEYLIPKYNAGHARCFLQCS